MSDFFMREDAPLDKETWGKLDEVVKQVAEQRLVGRRVISLFGPLGLGTLAVPKSQLGDIDDTLQVTEQELLQFTTLQQDFLISWKELASTEHMGIPLDLITVAEAASRLATQEDELIFDGLRKAKGTQGVPLGEWEEKGGAFAAVSTGLQAFSTAGVFGPFALVVSPALYAMMQRVMAGTGRLELTLVKELINGGVYFSPILKPQEAFLIASAPYHIDLAIAQDIVTAYLGNEGMDHQFRLLERIALRIKRPAAICIFK